MSKTYRTTLLGKICLGLAAFLLSFGNSLLAQSAIDSTAPRILHEPIEQAVEGSVTPVSASIIDDSELRSVTLYYKKPGDGAFRSMPMKKVPNSLDTYIAEIRKRDVVAPQLEYYIVAIDEQGNKKSRGFPFEPLQLAVNAASPDSGQTGASASSGSGFSMSRKTLLFTALGVLALGAVLAGGGGDDKTETINSCAEGGCGTIEIALP